MLFRSHEFICILHSSTILFLFWPPLAYDGGYQQAATGLNYNLNRTRHEHRLMNNLIAHLMLNTPNQNKQPGMEPEFSVSDCPNSRYKNPDAAQLRNAILMTALCVLIAHCHCQFGDSDETDGLRTNGRGCDSLKHEVVVCRLLAFISLHFHFS